MKQTKVMEGTTELLKVSVDLDENGELLGVIVGLNTGNLHEIAHFSPIMIGDLMADICGFLCTKTRQQISLHMIDSYIESTGETKQ